MSSSEWTPFNARNISQRYSNFLNQTEARYLMAQGRTKESEKLYKRVQDYLQALPLRADYVRCLFLWAQGLTNNGRFEEALPLIREGLSEAETAFLPGWSAQLSLLHARVSIATGDLETAKRALEDFEDIYSELTRERQYHFRLQWVQKQSLLAQLYRAEGNAAAATTALENGLGRLKTALRSLDAGVQGYLWVGKCKELRELLTDFTANDPALGYGAQLYWLHLYRTLGYEEPGGRNGAKSAAEENDPRPGERSVMVHLSETADTAIARITNQNLIHLVYYVRNDEIWRWTATSEGVRRDVLSLPAQDFRRSISKAWATLSSDPGSADALIPQKLIAQLHDLAVDLLPKDLLNGSRTSSQAVLITTGGILERFPFEVLNCGSKQEYTPLLALSDIAYLRCMDGNDGRGVKHDGIVLANSRLSQEVRQRYPMLGELSEINAEGETVAALHPGSKLFLGEEATKSNITSNWDQAGFIYFATHVLSDPEVPYLKLIPLSVTEEPASPEDHYLDIADIRSAGLNGCRIVVLSGCSSGAPYLTEWSEAPSLADAFLDAGVGAVVQTFWKIKDADARRLMSRNAESWDDPPLAIMHALCDVRRSMMESQVGIRHPFSWAAYSIKMARF